MVRLSREPTLTVGKGYRIELRPSGRVRVRFERGVSDAFGALDAEAEREQGQPIRKNRHRAA